MRESILADLAGFSPSAAAKPARRRAEAVANFIFFFFVLRDRETWGGGTTLESCLALYLWQCFSLCFFPPFLVGTWRFCSYICLKNGDLIHMAQALVVRTRAGTSPPEKGPAFGKLVMLTPQSRPVERLS
jgi:hypothetical protein